MRTFSLITALIICQSGFSQAIKERLEKAINVLSADIQFKNSIISMYVVDANTGKLVFDRNSEMGLEPASVQKIVTSVTAFELLGKDYRYKTEFGYSGSITENGLDGNLYIIGHGDPTFGSWRWSGTHEDQITGRILEALKKLHISNAKGFIIDNTKWGTQTLPDGWVWQDIGNYYGAGCSSFNWHENQYEVALKPGKKVGDSVALLSGNPLGIVKTVNELTTAAKGTGDQVYVYYAPYSMISFLRGTAPLGIDTLKVAASTVDGVPLFQNKVLLAMHNSGIFVPRVKTNFTNYLQGDHFDAAMEKTIINFVSPTFDSMNYWFLKKSINLYGEAFLKTMAFEKTMVGSTDTGVSIIRDFWAMNGIEKQAMKIIDGSGLSPANRITTSALVRVLQFAKKRSWFSSFYHALPEMNGIKMKDGYITGVRSYTGFVRSSAGTEYSFAFIVNNFDGNPGMAREKIWRILDLLK